MKLLFDENLSHRLPGLLADIFPDADHLKNCSLAGQTDDKIWEFARENGYIIVSKDSDFFQRTILRGSPPAIVWLRIGNCTTSSICELLRLHEHEIRSFAESNEEDILTLS